MKYYHLDEFLLSQIALEVVISTTFGAANDENVVKMMIFLPFSFRELIRRYIHCGSRRVNNLIMSIFWVHQEFWFNCDRAKFVVSALLLAIEMHFPWWRHQMETFSGHLPFVRGIHRPPVNSPQRPVTRSFDVFFDLRLNEWLRKKSWGWWFETPSRPLLRHSNICIVIIVQFTIWWNR